MCVKLVAATNVFVSETVTFFACWGAADAVGYWGGGCFGLGGCLLGGDALVTGGC